jgi:predicted esterase
MRNSKISWSLAGFAVLLAVGLLTPPPAAADIIYFKDGFAVRGKTREEVTLYIDPHSKIAVPLPKNFFYVEDGARHFYFNPNQVQEPQKQEIVYDPFLKWDRPALPNGPSGPVVAEILDPGTWDEKWNRKIRFVSKRDVKVSMPQHMAILNPYYARVDAIENVRWHSFYLTKELGPDVVKGLVSTHPDIVETREMRDEEKAARRFKYVAFMVAVGWYNLAEEELKRIEKELKDVPDLKEKVEKERANLRDIQALERGERLKQMHTNGRHEFLKKKIAEILDTPAEKLKDRPELAVPEKVQLELQTIRTKYEAGKEKIDEAKRLLKDLSRRVTVSRDAQAMAIEGAAAILAELHLDNVARLEPFLGQARAFERREKQGGTRDKSDPGPEELMALAVSGWTLGPAAAEAKLTTAVKLWKARQFVLAYQKTDRTEKRRDLLTEFQRDKQNLSVEEIAQLITLLPPPEPDEKPTAEIVEKVTKGDNGHKGSSYLLQLPPEYHPARSYPVLFVLANANEKPKEMLMRWSEQAAERGFILVAPDWNRRANNVYGYSLEEQSTVLDALADLKRQYQIDTDRVFLFGYSQGANLACDVALSHPDLFAGVAPMCPSPDLFALRYWPNAQYLPFYMVVGDHMGDVTKKIRELFDRWLGHNYPVVYVRYRGRGHEWFEGELPNITEWMSFKKRAGPLTQLGRYGSGGEGTGDEFRTLRETDNRFYWMSTDSILPGYCLAEGARWKNDIMSATLTAGINRTNNSIQVHAKGVKQLSLWISRNSQGESMLDLDKPVTVYLGGQTKLSNKKVQPNLSVLLEDFYQRGDRQRLYVGRIDLSW